MSNILLSSFISPNTKTKNVVEWKSSTKYFADQYMCLNYSWYKCIATHTSSNSFMDDYNDKLWVNTTGNVGDISISSTSQVPFGWLLCSGQSISREKYPQLFSVLNTSYGSLDDESFNLPNFKGVTVVGLDTTQEKFNILGKTGGTKTHKLLLTETPNHNHSIGNYSNVVSFNTSPLFAVDYYTGSGTTYTDYVGNDQVHNNLQPYIIVNHIIKY